MYILQVCTLSNFVYVNLPEFPNSGGLFIQVEKFL